MSKDIKTIDIFDEFDTAYLDTNAQVAVKKTKEQKPDNDFDAMIDQYNSEKSRTHTGYEMYFAFGNTVIHHAWKRDTPEHIKRS